MFMPYQLYSLHHSYSKSMRENWYKKQSTFLIRNDNIKRTQRVFCGICRILYMYECQNNNLYTLIEKVLVCSMEKNQSKISCKKHWEFHKNTAEDCCFEGIYM